MNFENYHFVYNAQAYFDAKKKYPEGLLTAIQADDFDALCWALEEFSTQGELIRRDMGHDRQTPLKAETVKRLLLPYQIPIAKGIINQAIINGLNMGGGDEEIDEVLSENQKKTENN